MVRAAPKTVDGQDSKQKDVLLSIVPVDETIEASAPPLRVSPDAPAVSLEERWETAPLMDPEPEPAPAPMAEAEPEAKSEPKSEPKSDLRAESKKTPAPAPARRTGMLVAMSMGGGLLLGGGAVTAIALLGILLGGVGVAVVLLLWLGSVQVAEMPAAPVADLENPAAEAPVATPVTPATDASAGGVPAQPTPAETPATPVAQNPAGQNPGAQKPATPTEKAPASATPAEKPAVPVATTPAPVETAPAPAPTPAPAPAPAPAAKPAGGLVLVKVLSDPPAALLTVDGASRGRTPTKLELEPGTHQISLTAGSAKGSFTIDVAPGEDKFCYGLSGKKVVRTSCD